MEDLHEIFTIFKNDFPEINRGQEALGKMIHEQGGPLPDKIRWLIKVAVSAAAGHHVSLETHIAKAREAGASEAEIKHVLLLLIQTTGFPTFMEAYEVAKRVL